MNYFHTLILTYIRPDKITPFFVPSLSHCFLKFFIFVVCFSMLANRLVLYDNANNCIFSEIISTHVAESAVPSPTHAQMVRPTCRNCWKLSRLTEMCEAPDKISLYICSTSSLAILFYIWFKFDLDGKITCPKLT